MSALAERGDFIVGVGASADDADGLAATVVADFSIGDQTWLSGSAGRSTVDLPRGRELETWYADIGIDHYWGPAGARFSVAYWGDADLLDSIDLIGALYARGEKGFIAIDAEYRDFKLQLPPIDIFPLTEIPFNAGGLGISGRLKMTERSSFRFAGMSYEYNVDLRIRDSSRIANLLSISRLSLLSSLIDWRVSAGIGIDFGLKTLQLDVAKWRGAFDASDSRSATISFLTPMTDRTDIEISLGYDDSDLYGDVVVLSVFLYFYGGN